MPKQGSKNLLHSTIMKAMILNGLGFTHPRGNFDKALELMRKAESALVELGSPIAVQAKADRQRLENKVKRPNDQKK